MRAAAFPTLAAPFAGCPLHIQSKANCVVTPIDKPCASRSPLRNRLRWLYLGFPSPLIILALALRLPAKSATLERYEYSLPRMGTLFRIELYAASDAAALQAAAAAFDRVEELEEIFSDYRPDSELNHLSRNGATAPQLVSRDLFDILERSQQLSELSAGAFDITVGPEVAVWREARRARRPPSASETAQARAAVGYRYVELDPQTHTVYLKRGDMKLDLGGVTKGYAADQALDLLRSRGIASALIDAGGDITLGASPPGKAGWKVAIDSPDASKEQPPCTLILHDVAIATSGESRQFVEIGGQRYSHIVDPSRGAALKGSASTTIIAPDGTTADALATALSVLAVPAALRLVESIDGASAYLVRQEAGHWEHFASRRFPHACEQLRKRGRSE